MLAWLSPQASRCALNSRSIRRAALESRRPVGQPRGPATRAGILPVLLGPVRAPHDTQHAEHSQGRRWSEHWSIVLALGAWLTVAALGGPAQGRLSQVQTNDAAAFLPASAESTRAGEANRAFVDDRVAARPRGPAPGGRRGRDARPARGRPGVRRRPRRPPARGRRPRRPATRRPSATSCSATPSSSRPRTGEALLVAAVARRGRGRGGPGGRLRRRRGRRHLRARRRWTPSWGRPPPGPATSACRPG